MNEHRDIEVGTALATLDVPEHRPGFWDELEQRLMPDRIQRHQSASTTVIDTEPAPPLDLNRAGRRRPHRVQRRPLLMAAAVVVVVAAAAGAALITSRSDKPSQQITTAADIINGVSGRLETLRTLSGTVEITSYRDDGQPDRRYRFWRDSAGSFRLTGIGHEEDRAYDATSGVETWHLVDAEGNTMNVRDTGLAIGPPDRHSFAAVLEADVTTALQALRSQPDAEVREGEVNGRPAWLLETEISPDLLGSPPFDQRMELAIDRETMVPLRVTKVGDGQKREELVFSDLVIDQAIADGTFTVDVPPPGDTIDYGFRRVATPADATTKVGYPAPEPSFVPEGYTLTSVAWAAEAAPTGAEAANPQSIDVVTLLYTRGFEWFTVSTRRAVAPEPPGIWDDPIAGEGIVQKYRSVRLNDGRFEGVEAQLSLTQPFPPHLWLLSPELVLTVAGNLTADELVQVAESID